MQGIAQYTLLRKAWALRGSFFRWQKNNQRSLLLPMIIKTINIYLPIKNQTTLFDLQFPNAYARRHLNAYTHFE